MSRQPLPLPDPLPTVLPGVPGDLAERALALYRRLAAAEAELAEERCRAAAEIDRHRREVAATLARLAAQRFELERLLERLLPQLAQAGRDDLGEVLGLFARGWDAELARAGVEVEDLAGEPLTDELAEVVEVEAAVPDPETAAAVVRESLSPLVRWHGRVVAAARVITSVPLPSAPGTAGPADPAAAPQLAGRHEEEP